MNRRPVASSNIASIGWEPEEDEQGNPTEFGTLQIEFKSGHIYEYTGVPEKEFEALLGASSVGRYHAANIAGLYDERRVGRS